MTQTQDTVMLSEDGIVVSRSRVTIFGDNYSVNQLASTKIRFTIETDSMKDFLLKAAIVASVIIGIWIGVASESFGVGTFLAIAGIVAAFIFIKPKYELHHLMIGMSSGEVDAFRSRDKVLVQRISNAINEALAARA